MLEDMNAGAGMRFEREKVAFAVRGIEAMKLADMEEVLDLKQASIGFAAPIR